MLALLVLLGGTVLAPASVPADAEAVALHFVRGLASGSMEALAALSTAEATESRDWQLLRNWLETYDCISLPAHEVSVERASGDEMTLLVTVHGTAVARGTPRTPLPFPKYWQVAATRAAGEWKLRSILLEERVLARQWVAGQWTPKSIMACAAEADLETLLVQFAEELTFATDRTQAGPEVVRSVARAAGLPRPEVFALRARLVEAVGNNDPRRAAAIAAEGRAVAEAAGSDDLRAVAFLFSGTTEWHKGDYDAAFRHFDAGAALLDAVDDPRPAMKQLYMSASLSIDRGAYRDAMVSSDALARAAERFDWIEGRCITALQKSVMFNRLQDAQTSRHYAVEASRWAERWGDPSFRILTLSGLAGVESDAGNHDAAVLLRQKLLEQAAAAGHTGELALALARCDLAREQTEARRDDEAASELLLALEPVRKHGEELFEANILQMLARIRLRQGRPDEALRTVLQADAIVRGDPNTARMYRNDPSWAVRATLGLALRALGKPAEATAALRSSIDLIEDTRAGLIGDEVSISVFMRDKALPYRDLIALLVESGQLREAVVVAERFRAGALAAAVARGHIDRLPAMSVAERQRYDALNAAIAAVNRKVLASADDSANAALRAQLAERRAEQRTFLARLYAASPKARARNLDDPALVVGDAERLLPDPGQALLAFSVHDDETFVFWLERSGEALDVSVHRVPLARSALEERVRELVRQIEGRDLQYRRSASALHDLLLAPFASRIASKRLLYIVPDGLLWQLPFQALQAPDGRHLIERVAIAYAPSLTLLRHSRDDGPARETSRTLLAIADPLMPPAAGPGAGGALRGPALLPLPDARAEVRAIAGMYGRESRTLVGAEATETAAKRLAPEFPVLHFATHALIDDGSPMYSAIVLGASGPDDGLLEAREMMDLQLGSDLAILSACASASGDVAPGEGMVGMSWALMVAGCRNTVVSQWNVDSRSTAQLMVAFHEAISRRGAGYAAAMRQAQLALLRNPRFSHPYYWSPFVLISTSQ